MKKVIFNSVGHIFFVTPSSDEQLDTLAQWTMEWILDNDIPYDSTVYSCTSLEMAEASIAIPLAHGISPSLVVIGHGAPYQEITRFGETLRSCIPETWIIELVDGDSWLPTDLQHAFMVRRPIRREDWNDVLQHVFLQAVTPQWSRISDERDS